VIALLAACTILGAGNFTAPDNGCTPGSYDRLTRAQVCTPRDRPSLPAADRRAVLGEYGVPGWTGADGELDHRVPVFLGGRTVEDNIWPERGPCRTGRTGSSSRTYRRVCFRDPYPLRVRTARRIFLNDWRVVYRAWRIERIL
jgi:hypothetical protein